MNAQYVIIIILLTVTMSAVIMSFRQFSALRRLYSQQNKTVETLAFYERQYTWTKSELDTALTRIRDLQEDLAFMESDRDALRDEVGSLVDLIDAMHAASPITAASWNNTRNDWEAPF